MKLSHAQIAPEARAAYGGYCVFPMRLAPLLVMRLTEMREYALTLSFIDVWADTAEQLDDAIASVCFAHAAPLGRRRKYRSIAGRVVLDTIGAYEKAFSDSFLDDATGHYHPEPGTEYPFAVSDIGRAAADLLGDEWSADPGAWGTRAYLQADGESNGYTLAVSDSGVLHIETHSAAHRTEFFGVWPSDGLGDIAARVTATIRELRTGD
ncbi:hypothetical protein ABZ896_51195 [Streptomyces sp. NPDC047072]|uniref:hypothetical protein n=1 Tax=Streptomyces sp. NPDC047072 TaxID=3154809 RepID=UPI0033CDEACE